MTSCSMMKGQKVRRFMTAYVMVLALFLATLLPEAMTVKAAEELVMKVHYHREDGNYDGWSAWLWEIGGGDADDIVFTDEDGEMVATKVVTPGITSVGFIIRTPDWGKDIDKDQFIDISEMVSGTVHIYVESGVEGYTKEYGEDAVTGVKVSRAEYNEEDNTVIVSMTGSIEEGLDSAFRIQGASGEAVITGAEETEDRMYVLTLQDALELTREYTITFDGTEYKLVMPNIYSTENFEAEYTYTGADLGASWSSEDSVPGRGAYRGCRMGQSVCRGNAGYGGSAGAAGDDA